jgi:hypothetical protein
VVAALAELFVIVFGVFCCWFGLLVCYELICYCQFFVVFVVFVVFELPSDRSCVNISV